LREQDHAETRNLKQTNDPRSGPVLPRSGHAIAVVGNYGNRNLGDEGTLASLVKGLRHRRPDVQVTAFSYDTADTERRHGVAAVPARRRAAPDVFSRVRLSWNHYRVMFSTLRHSDLLVFGGGGWLDDNFKGAFHVPMKTAILACLGRLAGARVVLTSVGTSPID
jgi:polysaccharide pyruvyl transferase WcaK-like protein